MKIVLINCLSFGGNNFEPPIGITMIGGYLKSKGINVKIIDGELLKWNNEKIESELKKDKPDIVGVTSITYNRFEALDMLKRVKKLGIKTVYGGVHATFLYNDLMMRYPFIDIICIGEGEETMLEICQNKELKSIKGIIYRKDNKIFLNNKREFIKNIDNLPPGWDLLAMEKYQYYGIFASRGCPFNCNFCASPKLWERKLRTRSAKKVVDEIEYLIKKYGKKKVHIKDDTFTARKKWAHEVCDEIIKRKLNIQWECLGRIDTVDLKLLKKLKNAGCVMIEYGIESGNNKILNSINKMITTKDIIKAIELTKKANLNYTAFFILGHPGETKKSINETFEFAWKIRPLSLSFCPLDIFPGTQIYYESLKNHKLNNFSWNDKKFKNLQGQNVPRYENPELDEKKLEEYSKKFYARYAFMTLFDFEGLKSFKYLFNNEYVPFHLLIKNLNDLKIILNSFFYSILHKGNILKKIFGLIVLPFFLIRTLKIYLRKIKEVIKNLLRISTS